MPQIRIPSEWVSKLTKQQQITELDSEVRCKLGVSEIHGIGVFAIRNIKQGDRCFITPNLIPKFYNIPFGSLNKLFPEIRELIMQRWASVVNGSVFQSPNDDAGLLFFCNHSNDPNYDVVSDTALKDIKKGQEVLEDYRAMQNWQLAYPDLEKWISTKENQKLSILGNIKKWLKVR